MPHMASKIIMPITTTLKSKGDTISSNNLIIQGRSPVLSFQKTYQL